MLLGIFPRRLLLRHEFAHLHHLVRIVSHVIVVTVLHLLLLLLLLRNKGRSRCSKGTSCSVRGGVVRVKHGLQVPELSRFILLFFLWIGPLLIVFLLIWLIAHLFADP